MEKKKKIQKHHFLALPLFFTRLAPLNLLNLLTRPESTLTGLIQRLPRALARPDWLIGGDGCYLPWRSSAGHLNNINVAGRPVRRESITVCEWWSLDKSACAVTNAHFMTLPACCCQREDKCCRSVCVRWRWCMVRSRGLSDWAVFWHFGMFLTMCFNPVERSYPVRGPWYTAVLQ